MSHIVYLSLGTNLGNRKRNIREAIEKINNYVGEVNCQSSLVETKPWGFDSPNDFINSCVRVNTELAPRQLLESLQKIECSMGRTAKSQDGVYQDRIIDIDILLYDDITINEPDLKVPHPLMKQRDFVMKPLKEIMK